MGVERAGKWLVTGLLGALALALALALPSGSSVAQDDDGDGLTAEQEALLQTDPADPDTDGDGWLDGDEHFVYFTDPLSAATDGDDGFGGCPAPGVGARVDVGLAGVGVHRVEEGALDPRAFQGPFHPAGEAGCDHARIADQEHPAHPAGLCLLGKGLRRALAEEDLGGKVEAARHRRTVLASPRPAHHYGGCPHSAAARRRRPGPRTDAGPQGW